LANVIHHELRHIEIHAGPLPGEDLSTLERATESEKKRKAMDKKLDVYIPADLPTSKGRGIQTLDERNHQFQIEIGLRLSEADENAARQAAKREVEEIKTRKAPGNR
jgi:hypothetical protein